MNVAILRRLRPRRDQRWPLVAVALSLVAAALIAVTPGPSQRTATLSFTDAVGIYEGSEVRLMGVPIGTVTAVRPGPRDVEVAIAYDADHRLPADVGAIIVAPSVIADRFVQLTPAGAGEGPTLADGARVPVDRTRTPVELDEVLSTTNDLLVALGPDGANGEGSLNRALGVGAEVLRGQGPQVSRMVARMGAAAETLGASSPDLFGTLDHLARVTRTLAERDADVRALSNRLTDVAGFLAEDREQLDAVLVALASSLGEVTRFVRDNRELLVTNVRRLRVVAEALAAQREALEGLVRVIPVALNNLNRAWDAEGQAVRSRANLTQILRDADGLICEAIERAGITLPVEDCEALFGLLGGAGLRGEKTGGAP